MKGKSREFRNVVVCTSFAFLWSLHINRVEALGASFIFLFPLLFKEENLENVDLASSMLFLNSVSCRFLLLTE